MSLCWILYGYSWRSFAMMYVKDQVLWNVFGGTFSNSFRQNLSLHPHCQDVFQSTSCQIWDFLPSCWGCLLTLWLEIPARSGIFCLLVEVIYWPCGLKFVYPMINLAFLGIIIKVKFSTKFCLHSFKRFCLPISCDAKFFSSLVKGIVIED